MPATVRKSAITAVIPYTVDHSKGFGLSMSWDMGTLLTMLNYVFDSLLIVLEMAEVVTPS